MTPDRAARSPEEVLVDGHVLDGGPLLGHDRDPESMGHLRIAGGQVFPADEDLAVVGLQPA
jgi:hypothetical protein